MNKSNIEWVNGANGELGYTWNPVTGCLHGCEYCYARKITDRFGRMSRMTSDIADSAEKNKNVFELKQKCYDVEGYTNIVIDPYPYGFLPTFHKYRLDEPKQKTKGSKIFVCSMADLFGEWVPDEWIQEVFKACEAAPQHKYIFLTKNPKRYGQLNGKNHRYDWSFVKNNWWFGMTITGAGDIDKLKHLPYGHSNTFVSIEPIKGWIDLDFYLPKPTTKCKCSYCGHLADYYSSHCQHCKKEGGYSGSFRKNPIDWVIIGAETGPGAKPPVFTWVYDIIKQCREANIPVFMKNNLCKSLNLKQTEIIQEFPEGLK